jgi:hypothetical protein
MEVTPVGGQMKDQKEPFEILYARIEAMWKADPRGNSMAEFKDQIELRKELESQIRKAGWMPFEYYDEVRKSNPFPF